MQITSRTLSGLPVRQWGSDRRGEGCSLTSAGFPARHSPRPPPHPTSRVCSGAPGPALKPLLSSPVVAGSSLQEHAPPRPIRSAAAECERRGPRYPRVYSVPESNRCDPSRIRGNTPHWGGRGPPSCLSQWLHRTRHIQSLVSLSIHVDIQLIKYVCSTETNSPNKFKTRTIKHSRFVDTKGQL